MEQIFKNPISVKGTKAWRTYIGGKLLDSRENSDAKDSHFPEEWMFSTVRAVNAGREDIVEGLCFLEDYPEISLQDVINKYPKEILGQKHIDKWGETLGVLIKQIDSSERLTVQVHPDKQKARELFDSEFGKTECWHILSTRSDMKACLYLGFKENITREKLKDCFERQDYDAMLDLMHCFDVKTGETYLVCGGTPHAIGAGCLLVEVQEPTDYTIRIEQITPSGQKIADSQCHQGLGFDKMFDCFDYTGYSFEETKKKWCLSSDDNREKGNLIDYNDTECFSMQQFQINGEENFKASESYYCLYVLSGEGEISTMDCNIKLTPNKQILIPNQCKDFKITSTKGIDLLKMCGPKA